MTNAAEAARKAGKDVHVRLLDHVSLVALQGIPLSVVNKTHMTGPTASIALAPHVDFNLKDFYFLSAVDCKVAGISGCRVTRCGYTGEDGFEISVPHERAAELAELLLSNPEVKLAGLGCRDSLRLEAGLCLYGHDINDTTTPIEASLNWVIGCVPSSRVTDDHRKAKTCRRRIPWLFYHSETIERRCI